MNKISLNPDHLPPPTGAPDTPFYSWVNKKGPYAFFAGMVPEDREKRLCGDDLRSQARQTLQNLKGAVEAVGGVLADVCAVTVYVTFTDLQRDVYPAINPLFHEYFPIDPPARTLVGGAALPYDRFLIELTASAVIDDTEQRS